MNKPKYLTSSEEVVKIQKKNHTFRGFVYIEPSHFDYAETIGHRLCLNPFKVAKLLYSLDRKAVKAYGKFFELYPDDKQKVLAVINF